MCVSKSLDEEAHDAGTAHLGMLGLDAILKLPDLRLLLSTDLRLSAVPLRALPGLQQLLPAPCLRVLHYRLCVSFSCQAAEQPCAAGREWISLHPSHVR